MPRLLNLRALCARCEKAEATRWCSATRTALCDTCPSTRSTPIVPRSVVTALCGRCGVAPAAGLAVAKGVPVCEICRGKDDKVVSLRESTEGIVFDKMDFSGLSGAGSAVEEQGKEKVDLSYYKTKVPPGVGGGRKRANKDRR